MRLAWWSRPRSTDSLQFSKKLPLRDSCSRRTGDGEEGCVGGLLNRDSASMSFPCQYLEDRFSLERWGVIWRVVQERAGRFKGGK